LVTEVRDDPVCRFKIIANLFFYQLGFNKPIHAQKWGVGHFTPLMGNDINEIQKDTFLSDSPRMTYRSTYILPFRRYGFYFKKLKMATAAIFSFTEVVMRMRNDVK